MVAEEIIKQKSKLLPSRPVNPILQEKQRFKFGSYLKVDKVKSINVPLTLVDDKTTKALTSTLDTISITFSGIKEVFDLIKNNQKQIIAAATIIGISAISLYGFLKNANIIGTSKGEMDENGTFIDSETGTLSFEDALKHVREIEGGYVNDPADPGGATNKGITQRTYNAWLKKHKQPQKDVKNITDTEAKQIYYENYWVASGANRIKDPALQLQVFDAAVNFGVGQASKFLKQSGNDYKKFDEVKRAYRKELIRKNSKLQKFEKGWENRDNKTLQRSNTLNTEFLKWKDRDVVAGNTTARLVHIAKEGAKYEHSTGRCLKFVQDFLEKAGIRGLARKRSAYMMIEEFKKDKRFTEINVAGAKIGDIVVLDRTNKAPHGHIFISDGKIINGLPNSGWSDFHGTQVNPKSYGAWHVFRINEFHETPQTISEQPKKVPQTPKPSTKSKQPNKIETQNKTNNTTVKTPVVSHTNKKQYNIGQVNFKKANNEGKNQAKRKNL